MEPWRYLQTYIFTLLSDVLTQGLLTNGDIQYGSVNEKIVLMCNLCHMWYDRKWYKNNDIMAIGNLTNNERLNIVEDECYYNLHIHNVIYSDAGKYRCRVQKQDKVLTQDVTLLLSPESTTHDIERLKLTTENQSSIQNWSLKPEDNCKTFPYIWVYCASIVAISILIGLSIWVICKDKNRGLVHIENTPQSTLHDNTVYDHDWRDAKN